MPGHARFSASASDRWLNCTGSVQLIESLPNDGRRKSSSYADRGTALHAAAKLMLTEDMSFSAGETITEDDVTYTLTESDLEGLATYVDYVEELSVDTKRLFIEIELTELQQIHPELGGKLDFGVVTFEDVLEIVDFKTGFGVAVFPENNPQLIQYALGLYLTAPSINVETIRLTIIQPWSPISPVIRSWETTPGELIERINILRDAVDRAINNPTLRVGDWCRWCDALAHCPAHQEGGQELTQAVTLQPVDLTADKIGSLLVKYQNAKPWFDQLYALALALAEKGVKVPGMKLVPKRAHRRWKDEVIACSAMVSDGLDPYQDKMKSPAMVEKEVGKSNWRTYYEELVETPDIGYNLVVDTDQVKGLDLTPTLPSPKSLRLR